MRGTNGGMEGEGKEERGLQETLAQGQGASGPHRGCVRVWDVHRCQMCVLVGCRPVSGRV